VQQYTLPNHIPTFLALVLLAGPVSPPVSATSAGSSAPAVVVSEVRKDRFVDRLEALGTLKANESVDLSASVTEIVVDIRFDDGDRVEKGQLLVEMNSGEERAELQELRVTVAEAKRQYNRVRALGATGTETESLIDERKREWEAAKARLAAVESRIADRRITAPFSGVIGLRDLSVGALVEPGDLITTLDDDSVMKLEFPVPSIYLQTLRPGQAIEATAQAYEGHRLEGTVSSIDSRVDPVTRSIRVRAILPNPHRNLKPGMLMRIELFRNPREALVVPEEALVPLGTNQFVLLVDESDGNRVSRREVRTGARRPGEVEVLEGIEVGDKVITQGALKARPGQPVRIIAISDGSAPLGEFLKSLPE